MTYRVAICVPSGDMMHSDAAMSIAALAHDCGPKIIDGKTIPSIPIALINVKGSLVVNNRNKCIEQALKLGVTHVFFIDADIVMPPGTLRRLLSLEKDIVGATYVMREPPNYLLGKTFDGTPLQVALQDRVISEDEVMEVGALPGGCLLFDIRVLEKMSKPYFQTPTHQPAEVIGMEHVRREAYIEGEDYYFCRIAQLNGFKIYLDWFTSFRLKHLGQAANSINVEPGDMA